jgi:hypothetical protein
MKLSIITAWHEHENSFGDFVEHLHHIKDIYDEVIVVNNSNLNLPKSLNNLTCDVREIIILEKDFSLFWNSALSQIKNSHAFLIAPDEKIDQDLYQNIQKLNLNSDTLYRMYRKNLFQGKWHPYSFPIEFQDRLIPKDAKFKGLVHECIITNHTIAQLEGFLIHNAYENWAEASLKLNLYTALEIKKERSFFFLISKFIFQYLKTYYLYIYIVHRDGKFGFKWTQHSARFWVRCFVLLVQNKVQEIFSKIKFS